MSSVTELNNVLARKIHDSCNRLPTKRNALRLAKILSQDRVHPHELTYALALIEELRARAERAKV